MTFVPSGSRFAVRVRRPIAAGMLTALAALAGCAGGAVMEDAVPTAADGRAARVAASGPVLPDGAFSGPKDTGTYPNLNLPVRAATEQMTPAEVSSTRGELSATRNRVRSAGRGDTATPAELAQLRRIGATHAAETLKAIEGE